LTARDIRIRTLNPRALLQPILTACNDPLPGLQSTLNDRLTAIETIELEGLHYNRRVGFDDIGVQAVRTSLHGRRWNRQHIVQRVNQQPRIDELAGPQIPLRFGKCRLEPYRAGRLEDLIVENGDRPSVDLCLQFT